jgi:hypothetical protein
MLCAHLSQKRLSCSIYITGRAGLCRPTAAPHSGDYAVLKASRRPDGRFRRGLPVVNVNPTNPRGPRDIAPTPNGELIINVVRGKLLGYVDGGINVSDVTDRQPILNLKCWREWEGVEPTQDGANRPATVLKTARPTGTHPLPSATAAHRHPEHWSSGECVVLFHCSS